MHLSFNNIKSSQVIIDNEIKKDDVEIVFVGGSKIKINEELKEIIKIIGQVNNGKITI
jgi:coenzyme F420-reducing hydrogenase gamma subunit